MSELLVSIFMTYDRLNQIFNKTFLFEFPCIYKEIISYLIRHLVLKTHRRIRNIIFTWNKDMSPTLLRKTDTLIYTLMNDLFMALEIMLKQ